MIYTSGSQIHNDPRLEKEDNASKYTPGCCWRSWRHSKNKKCVEALNAENLPIYYTCELSRPHSKMLLKAREEKAFYGS